MVEGYPIGLQTFSIDYEGKRIDLSHERLKHLKVITISGTQHLDDENLRAIEQMTELEYLYISPHHNALDKEIDLTQLNHLFAFRYSPLLNIDKVTLPDNQYLNGSQSGEAYPAGGWHPQKLVYGASN